MSDESYFPPSEAAGGWRTAESGDLAIDPQRLQEVLQWHRAEPQSARLGAALLVVHRGHLVAEDYITGREGGPRPWTADICNDIKSSTKSVFGTAAGVFLHEHADRITLDTPVIGTARANSLIPQIWARPLTDPRKTAITIGHILSMTSGHTNVEPWWQPPRARRRLPDYSGPHQMYEYCFGWWWFEDIPSHRQLLFAPGTDFQYSNFGLEQLALAMRNVTGEQVGPYLYDRVLGPMGLPRTLRDNRYQIVPYRANAGLNHSLEPGWAIGGDSGCSAYEADLQASPCGANTVVGSTLRITARDFARLAYLWLRRGRWGERQLVPEAWLRLATRRHRRADGATPRDYGYTFWVCDQVPGLPGDTFMTHGDRLNDAYVVPSLDLVVVRQGNANPPDRPTTRHELLRRLLTAFRRV